MQILAISGSLRSGSLRPSHSSISTSRGASSAGARRSAPLFDNIAFVLAQP
jgi:hypothetical protein